MPTTDTASPTGLSVTSTTASAPLADANAGITHAASAVEFTTARRTTLKQRLTELDASLAFLDAEREAVLLEGTRGFSRGSTIREYTDERSALSDVIATLTAQIDAQQHIQRDDGA